MAELEGYARGAGVDMEALWLCIDDEAGEAGERCTTWVSNGGYLIGHCEDWQPEAADSLCVLRKTVAGVSWLELHYLPSLGGNALSINSHGFVQAINSLPDMEPCLGLPRNVIARWLSETRSPEEDFGRLCRIRCASGYAHNIIGPDGGIWSIESRGSRHTLARAVAPFVHTNHCLGPLRSADVRAPRSATHRRHRRARELLRDEMSLQAARELMSDERDGPSRSIYNDSTVARALVNVLSGTAHFWLRREADRGWVRYAI